MADLRYVVDIDTRGAEREIASLKNTILGAGAAVAGAFALDAIRDLGAAVIESTRKMETYQNQLRLIATDTADLERITRILEQTAIDNRTAFGETVDLFQKLSVATREMGVSQEEVLEVTSKFSQALQVAGADANTANGAIRQFGQAMASGQVRGDEFVSIVEALGPALAIMAEETGYTVGELREMSQAGELTAEVFFDMIKNSNALTEAFEKMQPTISQLEQQLSDAFDRAAFKIAENSGLAQIYKDALNGLLEILNYISNTEEGINAVNTALQTMVSLFAVLVAGPVARGILAIGGAVIRLYTALRTAGSVAAAIATGASLLTPGGWVVLLARIAAGVAAWFGVGEALDYAKEKAELAKQEQEKLVEEARKAQDEFEAMTAEAGELAKTTSITVQDIIDMGASAEQAERIFADLTGEAKQTGDAQTKITDEIQKQIDLIDKVSVSYGRQLDQLNDSLGFATERIKLERDLLAATKEIDGAFRVNLETETAMLDLKEEHIAKVRELTEKLEDAQNAETVNKDIIEQIKKEIEEVNQEYNESLSLLEASTRELAEQREALREQRRLKEAMVRADEKIVDYAADLADGMRDAKRELDRLKMTKFEREIDDINEKLDKDLRRKIEEIRELDLTPGMETEKIQELIDKTEEARIVQQQAARDAYEYSRSFEYGWKRAYEEYADDATNAAKTAEDIFKTATQGMEDALVGFIKTGKFEWKDFVNELVELLLRSELKRLIADIFGGITGAGGGGGGGGSILGGIASAIGGLFGGGGRSSPPGATPGFGGGAGASGGGSKSGSVLGNLWSGVKKLFGFENGGSLPAGQFGIVGEAGPELITGPATITPMGKLGGTTNVTYNISAVDAASFRSLVARDPEFIHAVAMKGGSSVPMRR